LADAMRYEYHEFWTNDASAPQSVLTGQGDPCDCEVSNVLILVSNMLILRGVTAIRGLLLAGSLALVPSLADACSCAWAGGFLQVAPQAPLIIIGDILRHEHDPAPAMAVWVREVLKGGLLDSGMRVQMGDGMHCRPSVADFPLGSRWVLALNGPGAKPGPGWALSHCGEFWLRLEGDQVRGSFDGERDRTRTLPLAEFRNRLLYPHFRTHFSGRVETGQNFRHPFGSRFALILAPRADGWEIQVEEVGRDDNLARLTPPLHFLPNPREIEGWQFLTDPRACAARPYQAEQGPGEPRAFIFSPEVGQGIAGPQSPAAVTPEEVAAVERFGRGRLTIQDYLLGEGRDGCPVIEWLRFEVDLEGGYGD